MLGSTAKGNIMRAWVLLTVAATGLISAPAVGMDQEGFVEDFTTLDRERWFVSDGWVNGSHQNCLWSERAVEIQGGVLRLSLDEAPEMPPVPEAPDAQAPVTEPVTDADVDSGPAEVPPPYICAEIQSNERFGFGVYEAAVRIPFASGTNSNFFTYVGPTQGELHNEIDFEFIARTRPSLQTNTYVDGQGGNEALISVTDPDGWHDIAFVWEPGRLRWYLNGTLIRTAEGEIVPDLPQKIYLSIWSTDELIDWMGRLEWTGPLVMQVERVAFTPLDGECQFEGSILCHPDFEAGTRASD
jgi:endo-1,3-1,4-beta-glycanase ExoK